MKEVKDMSLVEILDKSVDQEQLAKDLAAKYLVVGLAQFKAKVVSGEIDLIKGTELDKMGVIGAIEIIEKALAV